GKTDADVSTNHQRLRGSSDRQSRGRRPVDCPKNFTACLFEHMKSSIGGQEVNVLIIHGGSGKSFRTSCVGPFNFASLRLHGHKLTVQCAKIESVVSQSRWSCSFCDGQSPH